MEHQGEFYANFSVKLKLIFFYFLVTDTLMDTLTEHPMDTQTDTLMDTPMDHPMGTAKVPFKTSKTPSPTWT